VCEAVFGRIGSVTLAGELAMIPELTLSRLASCRVWTSRQGHWALSELATWVGSMRGPFLFRTL